MGDQQQQAHVFRDPNSVQTMDSQLLYQTIFQYNVIPVQVMVAWESVAYELGFSSGDVNLIEGNAKQKPVAESSLDMLKFWMEADGRIELLIAALKRIDKNNYAEQLRVACAGGTCTYSITQIAEDIAPYWHDVGTQLGIKNVDRFKTIDNPTEYKFKAMFKKWLDKQTCTKQEMFGAFHTALRRLALNRAAEDFRQNLAEKLEIVINIDIN